MNDNNQEIFEIRERDGRKGLAAYHGPGGEVVIPDGICKIDRRVFENRADITSVVIPEGVEEIDPDAFANCKNLVQIHFPRKMKKIWARAFSGCSSLKQVKLPEGLTEIDEDCFQGCTSLIQVELPEGLTRLYARCFRNCSSLTQINLPDSLEDIYRNVFSGCTNLAEIRIPQNVSDVRGSAFTFCPNLKNIYVEENNPSYTAENGALYSKDKKHLIRWPGASGHIEIPGSVEGILPNAFEGCTDLISVRLPKTLEQTGYYNDKLSGTAFTDCVHLTEFQVEEGNPALFAEDGVLYRRDKDLGLTLVSWPSAKGAISIPEGVSRIGEGAFIHCRELKEVQIPDSVVGVEQSAFEGCTGLVQIELPDSIKYLRNESFSGCTGLKQARLSESLERIEGVFAGCSALEELKLPSKTRSFDLDCVEGCTSLKRVLVPETLQEVRDFSSWSWRKDYPKFQIQPRLLQRTTKCPSELKPLLEISDEEDLDLAYLILYQTTQAWKQAITERMETSPKRASAVLSYIADLLEKEKKPKKSAWSHGVEFALSWQEQIETENLRRFYEICKAKKCPVLPELEADIGIQKRLRQNQGEPETGVGKAALNPVEQIVREHWKVTPAVKKLKKQVKKGIPYKGSEELCSTEALIWLIAANSETEILYGSIGFLFGDYEDAELSFNEGADQIAAGLDRKALMDFLKSEIFEAKTLTNVALFIPAYCRYADEEQMQKLISQAKKWHNWSMYGPMGRHCESCVQEHLYLSDTKAAMRNCNLELYAKVRGTDAQTLRDTVLSQLDLDAEGKKEYDLGERKAVAALTAEMELSLFDLTAGKTVKSMPKKDTDPALYEAAKKHFSSLKKEIKKLYKDRSAMLFRWFLNGQTQKAENWRAVYLGTNPLLKMMAGLIIWNQSGKTFTLKDGAAVDAQNQPYALGKEPIGVAHPMEMTAKEVEEWQNYYAASHLKQLFAQVWEPVYQEQEILPERYQNLPIPINQFRSQEKHGIYLDYSYGTSDLEITFRDCKVEWRTEGDFRHNFDSQADVWIESFGFEQFNRQVNHIVAMLDRWTIRQRILKDDASLARMLSGATPAQIAEYLQAAMESQAVNCTAVLLEYQKEHFPGIDPMDEFTLE